MAGHGFEICLKCGFFALACHLKRYRKKKTEHNEQEAMENADFLFLYTTKINWN